MSADVVDLTPEVLSERPIPDPTQADGKDERGVVLIVGGSAETTGAVALAGIAALRVGAGKLQLATVASGQAPLAAAVPEARVVALDQTRVGAIDPAAAVEVARLAGAVDAVVLGPGTLDPDATGPFVRALFDALVGNPVVVVDANALAGLEPPVPRRAVLIPNPSEMAKLLGGDPDDPAAAVVEVAARFGTVVALRGAQTWITAPGEPVYRFAGGHPGLATSGSGDTLAGALGGLAATGAGPLTATLWAVAVHAEAGHRLAHRIAPVGFLAREILDELPLALDESRKHR